MDLICARSARWAAPGSRVIINTSSPQEQRQQYARSQRNWWQPVHTFASGMCCNCFVWHERHASRDTGVGAWEV
jgi:hypothetical protein